MICQVPFSDISAAGASALRCRRRAGPARRPTTNQHASSSPVSAGHRRRRAQARRAKAIFIRRNGHWQAEWFVRAPASTVLAADAAGERSTAPAAGKAARWGGVGGGDGVISSASGFVSDLISKTGCEPLSSAGVDFGSRVSAGRSPCCRPARGRRGRPHRHSPGGSSPTNTAWPIVSGALVPWMR